MTSLEQRTVVVNARVDLSQQSLGRVGEPGPGAPTYPGPEDVWCQKPGGSFPHIVGQSISIALDIAQGDRYSLVGQQSLKHLFCW